MKVRLVKEEKLNKANENIVWLIGTIIENEIEMNSRYCPYRMTPDERLEVCRKYSSCDECEVHFYSKRKQELIDEYCVK